MQFLGDFLDGLQMAAVYLNEIGDLEGLREMQIELERLIAEDPILKAGAEALLEALPLAA